MSNLVNEPDSTLEDLLKDGNYMPTAQDLQELLNSDELDEESKDLLRQLLAGDTPQFPGLFSGSTYMAVVFVAIIFSVILFFGYKLYKSIKDKEKKREEKKKQKQMKKKK